MGDDFKVFNYFLLNYFLYVPYFIFIEKEFLKLINWIKS